MVTDTVCTVKLTMTTYNVIEKGTNKDWCTTMGHTSSLKSQ